MVVCRCFWWVEFTCQMSKKEKQLSTTPWINEEILAKIDYAPRQTQDPKVLILTQNFFPRQIKKSKTGYRAAKNGAGLIVISSHAGQFDQPPGNSVITVTYPGVEDMFLLSFSFVEFVWRPLQWWYFQFKRSWIPQFPQLLSRSYCVGASWGARFSEVPVNFWGPGSNSQIEI